MTPDDYLGPEAAVRWHRSAQSHGGATVR